MARQYGALSDWMALKMPKSHTFIIDLARHSQEIVADLKALQGRETGKGRQGSG